MPASRLDALTLHGASIDHQAESRQWQHHSRFHLAEDWLGKRERERDNNEENIERPNEWKPSKRERD